MCGFGGIYARSGYFTASASAWSTKSATSREQACGTAVDHLSEIHPLGFLLSLLEDQSVRTHAAAALVRLESERGIERINEIIAEGKKGEGQQHHPLSGNGAVCSLTEWGRVVTLIMGVPHWCVWFNQPCTCGAPVITTASGIRRPVGGN